MPIVSSLYFEFEAQWGVENEGVNIHTQRPHICTIPPHSEHLEHPTGDLDRRANNTPGMTDWDTHLAGHPREKFTLDIRVAWSNISNSCAPSTAGSHSFRNSGVMRTDFHAASEMGSSPTGTSRTARWMVSPDLLVRRWIITSVSSGRFDARALPLVGEPTSFATGTRFHSEEECEVRSWRKRAWALSRASYHDCRSLEARISA